MEKRRSYKRLTSQWNFVYCQYDRFILNHKLGPIHVSLAILLVKWQGLSFSVPSTQHRHFYSLSYIFTIMIHIIVFAIIIALSLNMIIIINVIIILYIELMKVLSFGKLSQWVICLHNMHLRMLYYTVEHRLCIYCLINNDFISSCN